MGLVAFDAWTSPEPTLTRRVLSATAPQAYEPGSFYRRELPFLLEAVQGCAVLPTLVLIDGHVWLDADPSGQPRPGLGAHLHAALGGAVPVVGLAKNAFAGAVATAAVVCGSSNKPLFVTSVGYDLSRAAQGCARCLARTGSRSS
ncbi:MAG: endonuclease V [Polyangiaceae bacterium]